jgi:hypothetical protein
MAMMVGKGINDIDINVPSDAYNTRKDIPTFNAYLTVVVRDSEGKVINVHRQRSHSPTANFISVMLPITYFSSTGNTTPVTNTGGTTSVFSVCFGNGCYGIAYPNSGTNKVTYLYMIQVGSGMQSNPYNAHNLASPIANGSGTGQLNYGQPSLPASISVSGSSAYFTVSQTAVNNSGSTIAISEVGIITYILTVTENGGVWNTFGQVLVWYDVLSSSISIPNGGSLTIYYTFTVNP